MKLIFPAKLIRVLALLGPSLALGAPLTFGAAPVKTKKILYFTKCSTFEHGVELTFSKDGSLFTPGYLAQFDAYFLCTGGDLLAAGPVGGLPEGVTVGLTKK